MIEFVIDELVLRGVAPDQATAVRAALELRLAELAPPPLEARAETFVRAPTVKAPAGSAAALGSAVAEAVRTALVTRGAP